MTKVDPHLYYLHEFAKPKNLEPIFNQKGLHLDELVSIIVEPTFYSNYGMEQQSMCDYLFLFAGNYAVVGEMKGSKTQRQKAIKQLKQGKQYCETILDYDVDLGLFIVYEIGNYYTDFLKL